MDTPRFSSPSPRIAGLRDEQERWEAQRLIMNAVADKGSAGFQYITGTGVVALRFSLAVRESPRSLSSGPIARDYHMIQGPSGRGASQTIQSLDRGGWASVLRVSMLCETTVRRLYIYTAAVNSRPRGCRRTARVRAGRITNRGHGTRSRACAIFSRLRDRAIGGHDGREDGAD
jgi:hypothetical protein